MKSSPWAKLTTSMMPKIKVSPEATRATIMPVTMPLTVWIRICSMGMPTLHSQVLMDDGVVDPQVGRHGVVSDDAFFDDVDPSAGLQGQWYILFDQQHGDIFAVEHVNNRQDFGHHTGHQSLCWLIQQDDFRLEHHRARNGEHLLLTTGERAAGLVATLGQYREVAVDLIQQFGLSSLAHTVAIEPRAEIFGDRQQSENPPIFRHIADPEPRQPMCRQMGDRPTLKQHPPLARMDEPHDRLERRALANPVATEEADHLAYSDSERDPVENMALAVIGMDIVDFDQRRDRSAVRAHVFR